MTSTEVEADIADNSIYNFKTVFHACQHTTRLRASGKPLCAADGECCPSQMARKLGSDGPGLVFSNQS